MNQPAAAICEAFTAAEFARARRLWDAYAADLRASIESAAATADMLAEALDVLEQSRAAVAVFRARTADTLDHARAAQAYRPDSPAGPRLVRTSL